MSMVYDFPSNHPRAIYFNRAVSAINTSVPDVLNIQSNPGVRTYPGIETLNALRNGNVDIGWLNAAHLEAIDPRLGAVNLPFSLNDSVMEAAEARVGLIHFMNEFCRPQGLRVIAVMRGADQIFISRDAHMKKMSDINGLRVRVAGSGLYEAIIRSVGACPVVIPISQVVPAIEREEIDCVFTSPGAWQTLFYKDLPYATRIPGLMTINYILLASDEYCSALPPRAFETLQCEFDRHVTNAWNDMASDDEHILQSMIERGANVSTVENCMPWINNTCTVRDEFISAWPNVLGNLLDCVGMSPPQDRGDSVS